MLPHIREGMASSPLSSIATRRLRDHYQKTPRLPPFSSSGPCQVTSGVVHARNRYYETEFDTNESDPQDSSELSSGDWRKPGKQPKIEGTFPAFLTFPNGIMCGM